MYWNPAKELDEFESWVAEQLRRSGKFFVFLRDVHDRLFDKDFQDRLLVEYGKPRGTDPIPPRKSPTPAGPDGTFWMLVEIRPADIKQAIDAMELLTDAEKTGVGRRVPEWIKILDLERHFHELDTLND